MENFIIVSFLVLVIIFLIIVISSVAKDLTKYKQEKTLRSKFNYKKMENLYEEFILKNKDNYNEIESQIKTCIFVIISSIVIIPVLFLFAYFMEIGAVEALIISAVILILFSMFIYAYGMKLPDLREEKNKRFKDYLIDYIIDESLSDFDYSLIGGIEEKEYSASKFYEEFDTYKTEDLMVGNLNTSQVKMCEVLSQLKNKREVITNFHGLFCHINLEEKVNGQIIITTKDKVLSNRTEVKTEDEEFNKVFNIYSEDKINTYTFLNDKTRKDLIDLYKFTKMSMDIKISKKDIFIRFNCGPIFENLIFTLEEKSKVYKFILMCEIIKDINDCVINN